MKITTLSLYIVTLCLVVSPGLCSAASLAISIASSTPTYQDHTNFELSVTFHNTSDNPYIVFPAYVKRIYKSLAGQAAEFRTYPGPAINPWPTAFILKGGATKTVTYLGMRNGDGFWVLPPGRYDLSVSLLIASSSTFAAGDDKYKDIPVWRGNIESAKIRIHYLAE